MRFTLILVGTALAAASFGGAASHLHATGKLGGVDTIVGSARDTIRDTMRSMDDRYYRRGTDYATCVAAYGGRSSDYLANADITFSCECFDRQMAGLGGLDRKTAVKALGPGPDADPALWQDTDYALTATAKSVLAKCDIVAWPKNPVGLRHPL